MAKHQSPTDNQLLRQHNAITEARYEMSALEKNIVYLLIKELQAGDSPGEHYKVSLYELQQRCDIYTIKELNEAIIKLISRPYEIIESNGDVLIVTLMGVVRHDTENKCLFIKISRNILPYLVALKRDYTEYQLEMALRLKSKYSKRLYEMLSQHKDGNELTLTVQELRYRLCLDKEYTGWRQFEDIVLNKPQKEINEVTDLIFTYSATKTGKKYTHLHFKIKKRAKQLELNL